jgi:lipopolysaccharide export system protein LptA
MTQRPSQPRRIPLAVATIAAALVVFVSQGGAQSEKQSPGLFKPLPQKRDEPVKITSATLEVRDKSKMATFSGDVHVIQGETEVRCNVLVVFYDDDSKDGKDKSSAKKAPAPEGGRNQQIRRMEAKGNVIVTQKEQRAVGDRAEFDMRTNTVTMIGNVVVTKGDDVLRGQRMVVDLTTGVSRVESGGGRVEGIFQSKSQPKMPGKQH